MTTNTHKKWPALQPGDIVDIVAPGCGCTEEEVVKAVRALEAMGLTPRIPDDIMNPKALALCSNSDSYRLHHLKESLRAKDSKALWCLRGGYGCSRILPELLKLRPTKQSKLFIGFSDITALHLFLYQKWKWSTIHGPVLFQIGNRNVDDASIQAIRSVIFGHQEKIVIDPLEPLNKAALTDKSLYSTVTGGNLCLLEASIGTDWQLKSTNHIIFIEEVGERAYRIDRMLHHLQQSDIIQHAQAIIFGDIVGGVEQDGIALSDIVIRQFAESMSVPVLQCKGYGHGTTNLPLPFGTQAILKLSANGPATLTCQTGVGG